MDNQNKVQSGSRQHACHCSKKFIYLRRLGEIPRDTKNIRLGTFKKKKNGSIHDSTILKTSENVRKLLRDI
jgi:hypothetical protein